MIYPDIFIDPDSVEYTEPHREKKALGDLYSGQGCLIMDTLRQRKEGIKNPRPPKNYGRALAKIGKVIGFDKVLEILKESGG